MPLQYGDDDFFDSEEASDFSSDTQSPKSPTNTPQLPGKPSGKRKLRIRPMNPSMMEKHPDVVTILLTRSNGQQLIFVRR